MKDFEYYRPTNVSEAAALLAANKDGRAFSGGMSLLPTMKLRLGAPTALVDLSALPGMTGITIDAKSAKIGGMTTHAEVADSTALQAGIPGLAVLASLIGDPQVRHREMTVQMLHPLTDTLRLVASPMKFTENKVEHRMAPPMLG